MKKTPLFFGKKPAKHDDRNLMLSTILKPAMELPPAFDFDDTHPGIPLPMFGNDQYGDCVIAGRAHQTLRFETAEQGKVIPVTEADVVAEWRLENGGTDNGLYVLDSLKLWRKTGWLAGGKRYKIKAFAQVSPHNHPLVMTSIINKIGIGLGMALPDSAMNEFNAGKPWADTSQPPDPEMGHYVYVCGYNQVGPLCITWARKQQQTWAFFDKYTDEAYSALDAKNAKSVNTKVLNEFLKGLKK